MHVGDRGGQQEWNVNETCGSMLETNVGIRKLGSLDELCAPWIDVKRQVETQNSISTLNSRWYNEILSWIVVLRKVEKLSCVCGELRTHEKTPHNKIACTGKVV